MRVLLTGASGQLGAYLLGRLAESGHAVCAWSGSTARRIEGVKPRPVDLADLEAVGQALQAADPELLIHAAAINGAEQVRREPERALAVNVAATGRLAQWCAERGRRMVFTSTDLVFDGSRAWWREDDPAEPVLAYGWTKRLAEPEVIESPRGLVVRLSLLYGHSRCGRESFFDRALIDIKNGQARAFFEDEYRTPLHLQTAADLLIRLALSDATGIVHLAGEARLSRHDLMRSAVAALGLNTDLVRPNRRADVPMPEPRPADVSLATLRLGEVLGPVRRPVIEEALASSP
jgi:dTDP-4-dehydrorhamnose reductase